MWRFSLIATAEWQRRPLNFKRVWQLSTFNLKNSYTHCRCARPICQPHNTPDVKCQLSIFRVHEQSRLFVCWLESGVSRPQRRRRRLVYLWHVTKLFLFIMRRDAEHEFLRALTYSALPFLVLVCAAHTHYSHCALFTTCQGSCFWLRITSGPSIRSFTHFRSMGTKHTVGLVDYRQLEGALM